MKIKNWNKFQHFKDRRPPWIKLHREILDQRDIMMISDRSFKILTCLWLLASEDESKDGNLPSVPDIAFRLRMSEDDILTSIQELTPWVENGEIELISSGYQTDITETEAYKEETEGDEKPKKKNSSNRFVPPSLDQVTNYCQERGNTIDPQRFIDHYESNGWKVGRNKMKSWQAAVRTWEKNDKDGKQQKTFEQMKVDNTKQAMVDFVGGRKDGLTGQGRICGGDGKAIAGISD